MKMYSYHVVSYYKQGGSNGYHSITYMCSNKIRTDEDVQEMIKFVKKETGFSGIIVLNWIELEGDA